MAVLLALSAALTWGTGDFFGGVAARRGPVLAVAFSSQATGLVVAAAVAPFLGGEPLGADLAWGLAAGVFGGLGLLTFYRGMATSRIAIVAPVAAIGTAVFPSVVGLASGDRLSGLEVAGGCTGLVAIWLLSRPAGTDRRGTVVAGLVLGLLTGIGFGGLLIGLAQLSDDAGFLPLIPTRIAGVAILGAIALATRRSLRIAPGVRPPVIAAGSLGIVGNGVFILAAREGPLALIAVLASLFPAATVILARVVLHEHLSPQRVAGIAAALSAVALISAG